MHRGSRTEFAHKHTRSHGGTPGAREKLLLARARRGKCLPAVDQQARRYPSRNDFKVSQGLYLCLIFLSGRDGLIHYNVQACYVVLGRAWTGSLTYYF